jgi:hypothetical protein
MTPSGIDPATFRFVAQCLNHCAAACHKTGLHTLNSSRIISKVVIVFVIKTVNTNDGFIMTKVLFILLLLRPYTNQHCTPFAISAPFFPQGQRQSFAFRNTGEVIRGSFTTFP